MATGLAAVRLHRKNEQFKKYIENTVDSLYREPDKPVRVSTKLAKWILLDHPTLVSNGKTYTTQVRSIGAGVQELYLTECYKKGDK